jgi:hypothetical protein
MLRNTPNQGAPIQLAQGGEFGRCCRRWRSGCLLPVDVFR